MTKIISGKQHKATDMFSLMGQTEGCLLKEKQHGKVSYTLFSHDTLPVYNGTSQVCSKVCVWEFYRFYYESSGNLSSLTTVP